MHLYEVLRRPLITEKNTTLQALGKYVFEVAAKANKRQIKEAVETAFKVGVIDVNVANIPGKSKRMGKRIITTPGVKKAIVTLKQGDKIEFFEAAK
ncbi:MAG: 50S ribosomal protein L23 [Chloroflexi bacterium]|nr:50S ribosomal protein L23 [Chloroflexota bacterium]